MPQKQLSEKLQTLCAKSVLLLSVAACASANPVHLRCEYRENPLGIDQRTPHLSWQSDNSERDWRQSAYEILVATSAKALQPGKADVWDSQKRALDESVDIAYAGPKLESRHRYYWTVRVWDSAGRPSAWASPAWWEMGLLDASDWKAQWITRETPDESSGIHWIWEPGQDARGVAPGTVAVFRKTLSVTEKPMDAALFLVAKGNWSVRVNGADAGSKTEWHAFDRRDITDQLVVGSNLIEITVTVPPPPPFGPQAGPADKPQPAAMAALVRIVSPGGKIERVPTGDDWQVRLEKGSEWQKAAVVGDVNSNGNTFGTPGPLPQGAVALRRSFTLSGKVTSARLNMTALGSYAAFLNGRRVGDSHLTPGWTDFGKHVQYQIYDVSGLLKNGSNTLAALLGDGWFASPLTWIGDGYFFDRPPKRLIGQLEIQYDNGRQETIATDENWRSGASAILDSEIYKGEQYDARFDPQGWKESNFDDSHWQTATVLAPPKGQLIAEVSSPIKTVQIVKAQNITSPAPGAYVYDMGQNLAGNAILKVHGPSGTRVRLRFAEILNPDGSIYVKNLRNADATNIFVLRGQGDETFTPEFTFEGFRYVEVTGYPGKPTLSDLSAEVISSLPEDPTATIVTPNDTVNKMWTLGIWGQRSNFISIPTDCPQRDERLGWTGDAGVFWRTGSYNFNIDSFARKWMGDMRDAQTAAGAFPNVAPDVLPFFGNGAPGWGDAGVIVPWTTWLQYGDREIVTENWEAMERWMEFIHKANPDFIRKNEVGADFADWLAPDPNTPKDLVDTAYWALIAKMMNQMAHAIGKEADAQKYGALFEEINSAFQKAYVKESGVVGAGTQTGYVVALHVGLYPKALEPQLIGNLVAAIEKNDGHLSTGFLGTPFLLFALSDHGRADVAYRLLLTDSYPSWGYMIKKGATTWWERWNGDTGDPAMNSYNHYSFGSVVAWLYRSVAGIDAVPESPGFHEIVIHPQPDAHLPNAHSEYESVYGKIISEWTGTPAGPFLLKITIPANTRAKVLLPAIPNSKVTEKGHAVNATRDSDSYVVEVGSGTYEFKVSS